MGETTSNAINVSDAMTDVGTALTSVLTFVTSNPICIIFIGFAIGRRAIGLFTKSSNAVK
ncbi:hypothetical protein [Ruminococcus sp.]|uniref:hypothetical protein n=1 Tax=Ruminococcus sp. TaxID=41978 RepID=UPI0025E24D8A|nr:hypothetical protein [Ruminococcus sp.]